MAVAMPLRPVMVFRPDEPPSFIAAFLQNSAQRLVVGAETEVVFPAVPGRVFKAKVERIQEAIAQGQIQATGAPVFCPTPPRPRFPPAPRTGRVP